MLSKRYEIWGLIILIFLLFVLGATISIILILNQKRFYFNKKLIKVETEFQKNMLLTQLEIQEQTFNQISREIHDHIGQRLTLARLYINGLNASNSSIQFEALKESSSLIEEAISDLKHLSRSLTANLIRDEGLLHTLQLEINRIQKITSLQIKIIIDEEPPFMSAENELVIFRIVQEALQNIIRHADATSVLIKLNYLKNNLFLEIQDNGKGFEMALNNSIMQTSKSGLENMKKRATLLNGDFDLFSKLGEGTVLKFRFPNHQPISDYAPI